MAPLRVAVIYDDLVRPDTTGIYCRRALSALADVEHFLPTEFDRLVESDFDLHLFVDDGLRYSIPAGLRRTACWAIDTHLDFEWALNRAREVEFVFCAQRDGTQELRKSGIVTAEWLPLACDPELHFAGRQAKRLDVCFVGHLFPGPRTELTRLIQGEFPNSFVGQCFFRDMAETYAASRIIFNRSLRNDVNMRVFEALASGSMLLTNDLAENGLEELLRDGHELVTYRTAQEMVRKTRLYLDHPDLREEIASAGRDLVLAQHTYRHRMECLLDLATSRRPGSQRVSAPASPAEPAVSSGIKTGNGPLVSIIIVTHNQWEYTAQCLESIRRCTEVPYELIVVDNGSTDETISRLQVDSAIRLVANGDNRGFPAAANQGLCAAKGDFLVLLNNDTIVTAGWLRRLLEPALHDQKIGLVGPVSNCVSGEQQIAASYDGLTELEQFAAGWSDRRAGQRMATDRLVGFCLLIRREVIDQIGLLDEQFGVGNFEDDDFCRRAVQSGYRAVIALDSFIHHFGSVTFRASDLDYPALLQENQRRFEHKWQGKEPQESLHPDSTQAAMDHLLEKAAERPASPHFGIERLPEGGLRLIPRKKLSLCMIVRDNERTIGPCLESIRPWVDELVIVDTGSADRTPEICREIGARVFHFAWCDDFAAARNESLRHARGEWIFWMDSDDTIPKESAEQLRLLVDGSHDPSVLGYVMQVHCPSPTDDGRTDVTVVDHVKLIRNRPDLQFEGRIHEQVLPSIRRAGGTVGWTDLYVIHSGTDHSPEASQRKIDRDLRILHREVGERPDHPFVLFNLGMTYADAGQHDQAVTYLERCLAVSDPRESHLRKAYALLVHSLDRCQRNEDAWKNCLAGLELFPEDKELLFRRGLLNHQRRDWAAAEHDYRKVLTLQTERYFTSMDQGLCGIKARHNLAIVYEDWGRLDDALQEWRTILEQQADYVPALRSVGDALLRQNDWPTLHQEISRWPKGNAVVRREAAILEGRLVAESGDFREAIRLLSTVDAQDPSDLEALRVKCRLLFDRGAPDQAESALQELLARVPDDAAAWHNLGTIRVRRKNHLGAEEALRTSVSLRPKSVDTHVMLGHVLREQGMERESFEAWQAALQLDPENSEAIGALSCARGGDELPEPCLLASSP